jgi:hypothetical protein
MILWKFEREREREGERRERGVQKTINRIRPNLKDGGRNKKLSKNANTRKDEYLVQNQGYSQKVMKIIEEKFRK